MSAWITGLGMVAALSLQDASTYWGSGDHGNDDAGGGATGIRGIGAYGDLDAVGTLIFVR